jgi:hypothetical protein
MVATRLWKDRAWRPLLWLGLVLLVGPGCGADRGAAQSEVPLESAKADAPDPASAPTSMPVEMEGPAPRFPRPTHLRGVYLNAWVAGSSTRVQALLDLARRTEVNAFVIDVKDASGYLSHDTAIPLARRVGADRERRIRDLHGLLLRLEQEGIYPIARIVVFQDPVVARGLPSAAVQDATGAPWVDGRGDVWVNPWSREIWQYNVDIAREVVEAGFPEIQWDYIRFPDRPAREMASAIFPGAQGRPKTQAIRDFLVWSREALRDLDVPLTADVFGVTTSASQDVGIGQVWEDFSPLVEAALPMVYPSHYWTGAFGFAHPNGHPYEIVHRALEDALRRNARVEGAGRIIPWLQDFSLGAPPYGVAEVRAQILAARDLGIEEWILWNASSRYTEGALEPVGGWPGGEEPQIRFGNAIIPAEDRPRGSALGKRDEL